MAGLNELTFDKLRVECSPDFFTFRDTSELEALDTGVISQERAVAAMDFGLKVKTKGFNIYIAGQTGTGKTTYARSFIKKLAGKEKIPDDWCYVFNFDRHNEPMAISLPAGGGRVFQKDMEDFSRTLKAEIIKAFSSEDYEKEKAELVKTFHMQRLQLLEKLNDNAEKSGFKVRSTNAGMFFQPVVDGKPINESEFAELDEKTRNEIAERSNLMQLETIEVNRRIKIIEKEAEEAVAEWEGKIALYAFGTHINDLKEKYRDYYRIQLFLDKVQENILQNLDRFREDEASSERKGLLVPWARVSDSPVDKYKVNLLVDNSELAGAPVIVEYNPTYSNLIGRIEYENEFGAVTTDFTMVKSGQLHAANGGYIILQAKDVLSNAQSWEALKRSIRTRQIDIGSMREQLGLAAVSSLKPEPIPLDIKVILVGSPVLYQLLYQQDEDFKKLFKIKVDFDEDMERNEDNIFNLARFVSLFCNREHMPHFDPSGVAKVVDYCSRLVENQKKLSTKFNDIVDILTESCAWAKIEGSELVRAEHVKKAVVEKCRRSDKYDKRLLEFIKEGTVMIDTDGEVVGQINGLSVLDVGDYQFGKPSRITAATYMGGKGIVNIEREIEMSGTSHTKGVLILSGYLGQKFAQQHPLSLSASLCFEQLYNGVDGDSASSTELYAILSSLAEVPIKQSIAVTGSVNQWGEIQPIGGATKKIEGFFELCKIRGLNGKQGVIIPHQNIKDLVLNDDVVEAVKEGKFHIHAVKSIDEGIEILTGVKSGAKGEDGAYPEDTINFKVNEKLKRFANTAANYGK